MRRDQQNCFFFPLPPGREVHGPDVFVGVLQDLQVDGRGSGHFKFETVFFLME